jgi:LacI family transcriptional regulator
VVTQRRPTLKDIAAAAGVSRSVATRALRGTGYVGERSKARVLRAAADLGYVPNVSARHLKERVSRCVGVLVGDLRSAHDAAVLSGVMAAARERGLATMVAEGAPGSVDRLLDFVAFDVAGVVVVPSAPGPRAYLERYGIPVVGVGDSDDREAVEVGRDALERLTSGSSASTGPA